MQIKIDAIWSSNDKCWRNIVEFQQDDRLETVTCTTDDGYLCNISTMYKSSLLFNFNSLFLIYSGTKLRTDDTLEQVSNSIPSIPSYVISTQAFTPDDFLTLEKFEKKIVEIIRRHYAGKD